MNDQLTRENDALAECVRHDQTGDLYRGEECLMRLETEERCVLRAMQLMAFLAAFAGVCLGYSIVLLDEVAPHYTRLINHAFGTVGVAAITSLVVFSGVWFHLHGKIIVAREKVRQLVLKLLADRTRAEGKR